MSAARTIYFPDPGWSEAKAAADFSGLSVSEYIRRAVEAYHLQGGSDASTQVGTEGGEGRAEICGGSRSATICTDQRETVVPRGRSRHSRQVAGDRPQGSVTPGEPSVKPFGPPITKAGQTRKRGKG